MDYKKAFYSKLEDCYLGAKIKQANKDKELNKSGFTNLLAIKEKYFNYVKNYLERRIDFQNSEDAIEIYNKLYTFFDSYLNETGTPFFIDTPIYKNIYARVYSNSKDTSLFYKTQGLYYVKSDIIFESLTLSDSEGKYNFYFDTSEFKQNSDNNKSKVFFKLYSIGLDENDIQKITIKVSNQKDLFPELSNVFKQNSNEFNDEFLKALIIKKIKIKEEELKKIFRSYKKQNEIDFFIHKNAKAFLEEQFDLWMFNHLYKDSQIQQWNPDAIKRMQKVRNIAYEIIYFIAKFEDELKAIWLKPKFAKKTEYVFSLDIIINKAKDYKKLLDDLFKDKNFKEQIKEWKELNLIDDDFNISSLRSGSEAIHRNKRNCHDSTYARNDKYKFLPIDTKYLSKENKFALLSSFEDLESLLNGELIKGDNFQALNTLMPKYQGKIDLIYIDPPYNTGNDDFIYADKFNHASWISMINNRLELGKNILNNSGSIFVSIDDNEQANLKLLMDSIFGDENFVSNIIWEKKYSPANDAKYFSDNHDFILSYARNKEVWKPILLPRTEDMNARYTNPDNDPRGVWKAGGFSAKTYSENYDYPITTPSGKVVYPPSGSCWQTSKENYERLVQDNRIYFGKNNDSKPQIKQFLSEVQQGIVTKTLWRYDEVGHNQIAKQEMKIMFDNEIFDTPKPEKLLKRILEIASKENSIILDFFAGSGTTPAVALKLGRKFVGVEMGEHFYKVILPRLKKVIAGFQSGISKESEYKGGGAFRYYELESYEEALLNCEYVLKNINNKKINLIPLEYYELDKISGYVLDSAEKQYNINDYYNNDFYNENIIDYRKSRKLIKKLNKAENKPITINMSVEYREEFDIFQTTSNIMGWKIKRLFLDKKGVESCEYDNGEILNNEKIDLYRYPKLKSLIWWR